MKRLTVAILLSTVLAGCGDECERHDDCSDDEYCQADEGEREGSCVPRKERGEPCQESRECEEKLVCSADEFDGELTCKSPKLMEWDVVNCAAKPGANGSTHPALLFAVIAAGAFARRRRRAS